ncbi:MAG: S8 family serine peptidase, partial [Anaerolineae bacterium]|nr:S8 family serine peptidase [Anaerolineae bacterium]
NLLVVHQHRREYLLLGRRFMAFTIFVRTAHRDFHLLVDLKDGSVVDDVEAVERAESEARHAKYGKLHPLLYERLQTADDKEVLPVAIWVGGERGRSREEVYIILGRRYPEVQQALARHASIFDVSDPVLAWQIQAEYERMRQDDITARVQPLVTYLESRDIVVETHYLLPSVTAMLSEAEIVELARRDDVQAIYLVAGEGEPMLDTAVHTNRIAPVWSALGLEGIPEPTIPITIAIVENGNVDWDNSFLHHTLRLVAPNGETDHATRVASDAASFHDTYRGMAPGATILSAGSDDTMPGVHFALNWALDQDANVVNVSYGWYNNTPELEWLDRAFDYTARERRAVVTVPAGNRRNEYIICPAKGWNVITVGGINDQGNTNWSDDTMYQVPGTNEGSSYLDPGSSHGDREKPEIAAPAQDITSLGLNDVPQTRSGTSHAAPQVAGLVALLMHDNAELKNWPTAVKAILMASAMHNVEGDSRLSDEDGAGSIDASRAYTIAHHYRNDGDTCWGWSCWWAVNTTSTYPTPGNWLRQSFFATQGDLIRVAIAWWSEADPPPAYPTLGDDALTSNFDLYVWDSNGNLVSSGYSASWDNNYEIVQFSAPQTGIYEIGTYKSPNGTTESDNQVGIAVLRIRLPFRVYLPLTVRNYP